MPLLCIFWLSGFIGHDEISMEGGTTMKAASIVALIWAVLAMSTTIVTAKRLSDAMNELPASKQKSHSFLSLRVGARNRRVFYPAANIDHILLSEIPIK